MFEAQLKAKDQENIAQTLSYSELRGDFEKLVRQSKEKDAKIEELTFKLEE